MLDDVLVKHIEVLEKADCSQRLRRRTWELWSWTRCSGTDGRSNREIDLCWCPTMCSGNNNENPIFRLPLVERFLFLSPNRFCHRWVTEVCRCLCTLSTYIEVVWNRLNRFLLKSSVRPKCLLTCDAHLDLFVAHRTITITAIATEARSSNSIHSDSCFEREPDG